MKLFKFLRASVLALALAFCAVGMVHATELVITVGSVIPDDGYQYQDGTAGEALTAGQAVYVSSGTTYKLAHCETSAATAAVRGITLHAAGTGQPIRVMTGGTYTVGATVALGKVYVLGTSGKIQPVDDFATNDYVTTLGVATSTTKMRLLIYASGVKHP